MPPGSTFTGTAPSPPGLTWPPLPLLPPHLWRDELVALALPRLQALQLSTRAEPDDVAHGLLHAGPVDEL
eukprot:210030-Chlamydomonas_euryale.AAC.4